MTIGRPLSLDSIPNEGPVPKRPKIEGNIAHDLSDVV